MKQDKEKEKLKKLHEKQVEDLTKDIHNVSWTLQIIQLTEGLTFDICTPSAGHRSVQKRRDWVQPLTKDGVLCLKSPCDSESSQTDHCKLLDVRPKTHLPSSSKY
jgi:hypothetical protein